MSKVVPFPPRHNKPAPKVPPLRYQCLNCGAWLAHPRTECDVCAARLEDRYDLTWED